LSFLRIIGTLVTNHVKTSPRNCRANWC